MMVLLFFLRFPTPIYLTSVSKMWTQTISMEFYLGRDARKMKRCKGNMSEIAKSLPELYFSGQSSIVPLKDTFV